MRVSIPRGAFLLIVGILIISSVSNGSADSKSSQELKLIQSKISADGHNWTAGRTSVSDLSMAEKLHRLGLIRQPPAGFQLPVVNNTATVSSKWDWRNVGGSSWVTPVKDQGDCGSCVAFATVATIESAAELHAIFKIYKHQLYQKHKYMSVSKVKLIT